ncbi:MAG TPA: DUF3775 domain-containing protein [Gammaproteobacteria bacterium]|nr:DUF3775 domain-containing protein [Gammaproteobacteria bacterium]
MKRLSKQKVEQIIGFAEAGELDNVIGAVVRLAPEELAELKALTWVGRETDSPRHWEALVIEARAKLDAHTPRLIAEDAALGATLRRALQRMEEAGRI